MAIAKAEDRRDRAAPGGERVAQVLQRSAADTAADEESIADAVDREGAAQRAREIDGVSHGETGEPLGAGAAPFDEQPDALSTHGEQRQGPAQKEAAPRHGDHDELPGRGFRGDPGCGEVEGRERAVVPHLSHAAVGRLGPLPWGFVLPCADSVHEATGSAGRSCDSRATPAGAGALPSAGARGPCS